MKACPHCGLPLESPFKPVPKHRFVSHFLRVSHRQGQVARIEEVPFNEFHAREARTILHELGLTIERATALIDRWNSAGKHADITYHYTLVAPR